MTKSDAIKSINKKFTVNHLNMKNTHWSNLVNYGSEIGWWLNIPFHKFSRDIHIILNVEGQNCLFYFMIPGKSVQNPEERFRNKNETADIFMTSSGRDRLIDTQSGSTRFNFNIFDLIQMTY